MDQNRKAIRYIKAYDGRSAECVECTGGAKEYAPAAENRRCIKNQGIHGRFEPGMNSRPNRGEW